VTSLISLLYIDSIGKWVRNYLIFLIDLSNGDYLNSIRKALLSIGLLHLIIETYISVVEGNHTFLSIRSICQMENTYIRSKKSCFPLECCISLRLHLISETLVDSFYSVELSNGKYLYSIEKIQLSIGLLHLIRETWKNIAVVEEPREFIYLKTF